MHVMVCELYWGRVKKIQVKRTAWVRGSGIVKKSNGKEIIILFVGHSGTKLSKNVFPNVFAHQQV